MAILSVRLSVTLTIFYQYMAISESVQGSHIYQISSPLSMTFSDLLWRIKVI